ncbi:MAG: lysostaphin resistance A-like protein [Pyrinomonadaceae bacterium]
MGLVDNNDERSAERLRGFGPVGILAMLVILAGNLIVAPISAVLVLIWARMSKIPWHEIGFVRPRRWIRTVAVGVIFGVAFKLLMKAVVMPLLGAPATNQTYHYLTGNRAALPAALYAVIIGAGFGEETLFRGYLFERFERLLGRSLASKTVTVLVTSVFFGSFHYFDQGLPGVEQATIFGIVFGTIFAITRRIWMLIIAHAAFDLTAVAIIYWDFESTIAQFFFK